MSNFTQRTAYFLFLSFQLTTLTVAMATKISKGSTVTMKNVSTSDKLVFCIHICQKSPLFMNK